jgi:CRISPR-associated protein Cmr3
MMTQYNVSVRLIPPEHYFFGDENLSTDGTEKYYQRSLQLPQQTTVLGAMRFLLLQTADKKVFDKNEIRNKNEAQKLIGESSFDMHVIQYGKITAISEVLLWHENNGFYLPMLAWKDDKGNISTEAHQQNNKYFFDDDKEKTGFSLPDYKAKDGVKQYWTGQDGKPFEKEIFTEYRHAGNFKNKDNKTENDDDAYFKMCFCRLDSEFSFVFNMNIADENLINTLVKEKRIVYVGGERSKFICEIERLGDSNPKRITEEIYKNAYSPYADANYTKVILTSDAYTEKNPYTDTLLAVSHIKKFRFMESKVATTDAYNNRIKDSRTTRAGLKQSKLFNLLQRGSVFYFDKEVDIDCFLRNAPFETIGYNKFYKF